MDDGQFCLRDWATNATRASLENTIMYTYYSLWGIMFFISFAVLPFVYFAYEEQDEDDQNNGNVWLRALVFTLVFLLALSALLLIGAFLPFVPAPAKNSTTWQEIDFIVDSLSENKGKDALGFTLHVLAIYGMLNLVIYTGFGLASFPITLMKGFRPLSEEEAILSESQATTQTRINALRRKQSKYSLSSQETSQLAQLEEEENLFSRRSQLLDSERQSFCYRLTPILRIINAICGIVGMCFSILLWISLLLNNIDKLINSIGFQHGYILVNGTLPKPVDYLMLKSQKVFPLDYIFFFSIIIYLLLCTISAMRSLKVCCFCIPMYRIRPGRSQPQGLILLSFILIFTVLAFHILMFSVTPDYATFGHQNYCSMQNGTCFGEPCSLKIQSGECLKTRSGTFILAFAYKAWLFSVFFFWMSWGVLAMFLISLVVNLKRSRRSTLEEAIDRDDFDDSYDDRLLSA
ncbi:lysosomal cobalamin transport escort protein LMBD1-like [Uloborus diversus]|uniref:lysosomal cobalamin transport escort protein LMBD1-like n=1 Tax=Uloborus diversus TaxID=327109 RepID=UPI0024092DED|nr:lysosomal cobalamin transport escort protein LMBD1-like [Uloborus diversus]